MENKFLKYERNMTSLRIRLWTQMWSHKSLFPRTPAMLSHFCGEFRSFSDEKKKKKTFSSNEPKTKSSTIYINTSSGTVHMPFIRTSPPRSKSCTQPTTRDFTAHKILVNKFPKSGVLRKPWKAIYFLNFFGKDTNSIYKKKGGGGKSRNNYSDSNSWNLIDFTKETNAFNIILCNSEPTSAANNGTSNCQFIFKTHRSNVS